MHQDPGWVWYNPLMITFFSSRNAAMLYIIYSIGICSCVALVLDVLPSELFLNIPVSAGCFLAFSSKVPSCKPPRRKNQKHSHNSVLCLSVNLHIYGLCRCQMCRDEASRGSLQRIWPWMSRYKMHLLSRHKAKWIYFHKEQIETSPMWLQQVHV